MTCEKMLENTEDSERRKTKTINDSKACLVYIIHNSYSHSNTQQTFHKFRQATKEDLKFLPMLASSFCVADAAAARMIGNLE
jgi:hypothetical protein